MRDNTERLRPPRFLWVPFELGRPFGAPDAPDFQMRVLRAALALLARTDGPPLLEDFPDDPPDVADDGAGWVCPVRLPPPPADRISALGDAVRDEISRLEPWYALACETRGRTAFGAGDLALEPLVGFLAAFQARGTAVANPFSGRTYAEMLRLACADLRCWYLEAAAARPGPVNSKALADWFWGETAAARLLLALHPVCVASDDPEVREFGETQLVPRAQRVRLGT